MVDVDELLLPNLHLRVQVRDLLGDDSLILHFGQPQSQGIQLLREFLGLHQFILVVPLLLAKQVPSVAQLTIQSPDLGFEFVDLI